MSIIFICAAFLIPEILKKFKIYTWENVHDILYVTIFFIFSMRPKFKVFQSSSYSTLSQLQINLMEQEWLL